MDKLQVPVSNETGQQFESLSVEVQGEIVAELQRQLERQVFVRRMKALRFEAEQQIDAYQAETLIADALSND